MVSGTDTRLNFESSICFVPPTVSGRPLVLALVAWERNPGPGQNLLGFPRFPISCGNLQLLPEWAALETVNKPAANGDTDLRVSWGNLARLPLTILETSYLEPAHRILPEQSAGGQSTGVNGDSGGIKAGLPPRGEGAKVAQRKAKICLPLPVTCCPPCQGHSCLCPWSPHMWHPREAAGPSWQTANFLSALSSGHTASAGCVASPSTRESSASQSIFLPLWRLLRLHPFLSSGLVFRAGWSWFCQLDWKERCLGPVQQQTCLECACGGIFREDQQSSETTELKKSS